ncbi:MULTISPECIES: hypothetical protein [Treponema]|uniref:hypothetical protein n=1 Tax=Treponema TaxID=157 RepID=UPI000313F79B|nr:MULTISPECIES: hypothetical protein [Treponema]
MNAKQSFDRTISPLRACTDKGLQQRRKAYFALQSMERARRGTAESPVFCEAKNAPE